MAAERERRAAKTIESDYGVPDLWLRAIRASERSVNALQHMGSSGSSADQAMTDRLAPLQSQLDRLLLDLLPPQALLELDVWGLEGTR